MANKNHKPACKCVACSPATRKKGQAALKARRKNGTAEAKPAKADKPAKTRKPRKVKSSTARANETTTVVVNMPATPAQPKAKTPRKARRKNGTAPAQTAAPAEPRARTVGLPSLEAGRFLVIVARDKKGVTAIKAFPTQKAAREYAATLTAERVRVCEVSHSAG